MAPTPIEPVNDDTLSSASDHLQEGGLVAFPTETVYGLGADARNDDAVARIFAAKDRPSFNPLIVHVADLAAAETLGAFDDLARSLAERYWPGPLSLVLPRLPDSGLSLLVSAGLDTVALRAPAHPLAQDLLARFGGPIAAPSANRAGEISPTTASHVSDSLGDAADLIIDGGACMVGLESTVIDLCGARPAILRHGAVTQEQLERMLGPIDDASVPDAGQPSRSPGQITKHYAPSIPLRINATDLRPDEAFVAFGEPHKGEAAVIRSLSPSGDVIEAAARLFATLRELDRSEFAGIAVAPVPDTGIGRAVNDRLRRGAAANKDTATGSTRVLPASNEGATSKAMNKLTTAPETDLPDGLLERLTEIVGEAGLVTDVSDMEPYIAEQRGLFRGETPCVVRPASTSEVSQVVSACSEAGVPIVPQGGNTGLCGGAVASGEVILSLVRMNKVREVDPINFTMTVDAGCVLANLQDVAEEHDRFFPLSLGAEGSCQIGGNLSTNAGGTAVIRYGNSRELALGLEVVLPDGQIWDGLTGLRKNNTGYDLKHLFIGAEGTLGIITGAVLKLFPKPRVRNTTFIALRDLEDVLDVLGRARKASGDAVSGFELIPRIAIDISIRHTEGVVDFLEGKHEWYALIEFESSDESSDLGTAMENFLATAYEDGLVVDATIAQSESQRDQMWFLREAMVLSQKPEGASIKNDVSVPISRVPQFIREANAATTELCPGVRHVAFGHVGDGNVHYNLTQPIDADPQEFLDLWDDITGRVVDIALSMRGSFSAEHGIGKLKVHDLVEHKPAVELDMMRMIKNALDPKGLMNPGKVL